MKKNPKAALGFLRSRVVKAVQKGRRGGGYEGRTGFLSEEICSVTGDEIERRGFGAMVLEWCV